jgi:A/G-specific adenine glycosylase
MKSLDPKTVSSLHPGILRWYRKHQRELQWRSTTDPYEILVSEVMLQQTQVSRVQEKLPQFLRRFPTMRALARSSNAQVIRAWQGMGYNNRAVRLRSLAQTVVRVHNGKVPSDVNLLQSLPGIGPYTAHAVACFAFRKHTAVVDVNIRRVLSRVLWKMRSPSDLKPEKEIWKLAVRILPRDAYTWNQALIDLGAVICTARKPLCPYCPVRECCRSKHLNEKVRDTTRDQGTRIAEPMYDGIPRRIWRGKIVETLRTINGRGSIPLLLLGKSIKKNFKKRELSWLSSVVRRLEQDKLISTGRRASTTRVSLAEA